MNASEAAIPETAKKVSTTDGYSQYVEFSNGTGLHIKAWGIGEVRENFAVLKDILSDVFSDVGFDASDEANYNRFIDKQFNRIIKLVDSSIEEEGITLESVRGMDNIIRVIDAFIEVNGLFEAMGKVVQMATKAMGLMNLQTN